MATLANRNICEYKRKPQVSSPTVSQQCSTHATEPVHAFTFHFFCLSCENLRVENGRKSRSGFGGEEIISHLRELNQVLHMVGFVS